MRHLCFATALYPTSIICGQGFIIHIILFGKCEILNDRRCFRYDFYYTCVRFLILCRYCQTLLLFSYKYCLSFVFKFPRFYYLLKLFNFSLPRLGLSLKLWPSNLRRGITQSSQSWSIQKFIFNHINTAPFFYVIIFKCSNCVCIFSCWSFQNGSFLI